MAGTGGVYNDALPTAADLPMEETRSREEVRARLEAKRNKVTTPWGSRPVRTEAVSTTTSTEYLVDETVVERFVTPELTDRPARPARAAQPTPAVVAPTSTKEPTCPRSAAPSSSPKSATPTPPSTSPSPSSARPSVTPAAPTTRLPKPSAPAAQPATPTEQHSPASTQPASASSKPSSPTSSMTTPSAPTTTEPRSAPTRRSTSTTPPRTVTTRTPARDAASIVEGYLAGRTIPQLAATYSTTSSRVRRILLAADGLVLRDDRGPNSGGKPREYPPEQVDAVRRLYLEQGLTQSQVADELRTTPKVISNLMARHGIEARPDVVTAGTHRNSPGTSTLAAYRAELDAADITPADLRAWARANGIEVPVTGLPPRHVFHTYLAAQAPDEPQPPASPLVRAFTYAPPDHLAALTAAVSNFLAALQAFTPATPFQEQ